MIKNKEGQTALILILLTAAALIFLASTLNWGRVAQTKSLLTIGADQSAALLASEAASYGEMQKQSYLQDENKKSSLNGILFAIIGVIIAIVVCIISWGTASPLISIFLLHLILVVSIVMAVANLVLQLAVVQPMITKLWNSLQKNQPIQQQFYEQGLSTALESAVSDQVNITDYLDWNANGAYGNTTQGFPKDVVGRFALFYSDRLKMLNQPLIPQVVFFYNQLGELINGENCAQNASDASLSFGVSLNPDCDPNNPANFLGGVNCLNTPSAPICQLIIPGTFPFNDACVPNSDTTSPTYTPYCDPCCQASVPDPLYSATNPNPLHPNQYLSTLPSYCSSLPSPPQCFTNNPFNSAPGKTDSPYPLLYDSTYQNNYTGGTSFLEQFGRDEQIYPYFVQPNYPYITPQGGIFPDGIYPFFWLAKDYSLEVDNITPASAAPAQLHWCTSPPVQNLMSSPPYESPWPSNPASTYPPLGIMDLNQLSLGYACQGADCCVSFLPNSIPNTGTTTTNGVIDVVGSSSFTNLATNPTFGEGGSGTWLEGDNQFCSTSTAGQCADGSACTPGSTCPSECPDGTPCSLGSECYDSNNDDEGACASGGPCSYGTYNGLSSGYPGGSCEWTGNITISAPAGGSTPGPNSTVDTLDDTVHTLSAFIKFSNTFLSQDVGTLSSTFSTWYPQAAAWIDPASNGQLISVKNNLIAWGATPGPISNWLGQIYTNSGAWCVPDQSTLVYSDPVYNGKPLLTDCPGGNCPTMESTSIGSAANWGDLAHVVACLQYNSSQSATYYNTCLSDLENSAKAGATAGGLSSTCTFPASCSGLYLGRSLTGLPAPAFTPGSVTPTGDVPPTCGPTTGTTACTSPSCSGTNTYPPTSGPGTATTVNTVVTENCSYTTPNSCDVPSCTLCGTIPCTQYNDDCTHCGGTSPDCKSCCLGGGGCESCPSTDECADCPTTTQYCSGTPTTTVVTVNSQDCNPNIAGSFANWAQNSLTLATDEGPKFVARALYLYDLEKMATNMQTIFSTGGTEIQSFLNGPGADLINASKTPPTTTLPYSVIYGWQDAPPVSGSGGCTDSNGNRAGCAHIVKVTAYSPGRNSNGSLLNGLVVVPTLPNIVSSSSLFTRSYTLYTRDGYVYVDIKRWDQDHSPVTFPNNHLLWQSLFHNPQASSATTAGSGLPAPCKAVAMSTNDKSLIGFGLEPQTITGLELAGNQISQTDQTALGQAFMLNDEGGSNQYAGQVDSNAGPSSSTSGDYLLCLQDANALLANAPESHMCAEYIASTDATKDLHSGDHDYDYTMKFVQCPQTPSEDLCGEKPCAAP